MSLVKRLLSLNFYFTCVKENIDVLMYMVLCSKCIVLCSNPSCFIWNDISMQLRHAIYLIWYYTAVLLYFYIISFLHVYIKYDTQNHFTRIQSSIHSLINYYFRLKTMTSPLLDKKQLPPISPRSRKSLQNKIAAGAKPLGGNTISFK